MTATDKRDAIGLEFRCKTKGCSAEMKQPYNRTVTEFLHGEYNRDGAPCCEECDQVMHLTDVFTLKAHRDRLPVIFGIELLAGQDRNGNTRRVYVTFDPSNADETNEYGEIEGMRKGQVVRVFEDEQRARESHAGRFVQEAWGISPLYVTPAEIQRLKREIEYPSVKT